MGSEDCTLHARRGNAENSKRKSLPQIRDSTDMIRERGNGTHLHALLNLKNEELRDATDLEYLRNISLDDSLSTLSLSVAPTIISSPNDDVLSQR